MVQERQEPAEVRLLLDAGHKMPAGSLTRPREIFFGGGMPGAPDGAFYIKCKMCGGGILERAYIRGTIPVLKMLSRVRWCSCDPSGGETTACAMIYIGQCNFLRNLRKNTYVVVLTAKK